MTRVLEWRIHVGAHKTATTHMQESLQAQRDWLLAKGLDFLPMRSVRALRLPPPSGRYDWRLRLRWPMRRCLEQAIVPLRRGPERVAISEENLIGRPIDLLTYPFYPDACRRLRPYDVLARHAQLHIFLGVRSFEKLLPSAYVQGLRFQHVKGGFEPVRAAAVQHPPSWTELVGRIQAAVPRARLSVWRFEDYRTDDLKIMSYFCGIDLPQRTPLPVPSRTRSPSAQAVAALEALDPVLDRAARVAAARKIADADLGDEPFDPFSPQEKSILSEAYEEDLANLARRFPGSLVRFG